MRIIVCIALSITWACGLPALAQIGKLNNHQRTRRKHSISNQQPKITSFRTSATIATIPCPYGYSIVSPQCNPPGILKLRLSTIAFDPDGDGLSYRYSVSGGKVVGAGSNVTWNLLRVAPGPYTATVSVKDHRGGTTSSSTEILVQECTICANPCPTLSTQCPEDSVEGHELVISLSLSGGDPAFMPTYLWSVSVGRIRRGHRTPTLVVDTINVGAKRVVATVVVGGVPPECQHVSSCEVLIRKRD
jgi:hypothetical protein